MFNSRAKDCGYLPLLKPLVSLSLVTAMTTGSYWRPPSAYAQEAASDTTSSHAESREEKTKDAKDKPTPDSLPSVVPPNQPTPEVAQASEAQASVSQKPVEEFVIKGSRATIQSSIQQKRQSTTVVEALSADDIGDIPALSIGEALETLTSAASHREQGGATEISIRGMGPYLGSTVINGREATNGSGDRSVNFSQFPSELFTNQNRMGSGS